MRRMREVGLAAQSAPATGDNRRSGWDLDPDQILILDEADQFARKELYPLSVRMDAEEWWPEEAFPKIGAQGLFGVTVPPEYRRRRSRSPLRRRRHAGLRALEPRDGAVLRRA